MEPQTSHTQPTWLQMTDADFLAKMEKLAKSKKRSHDTYHNIHLPELNARLNLGLDIAQPPEVTPEDDAFAARADLSNKGKIGVVYLGSSMVERFKTTGIETKLGALGKRGVAWNAGCGGDRNENVLFRFGLGMYDYLKSAQFDSDNEGCHVRIWVLSSGTNNLHAKRTFRDNDVASWRLLVEACLRIAPGSRVLACDVQYRKDIKKEIVDENNGILVRVVEEVNRELVDAGWGKRVVWVVSRSLLGEDMLIDHVHFNECGYAVWDGVLWPLVEGTVSDVGESLD
ncbi:hypothetical protein P280DRAFT_481838 [Massarina eburnea CBS 473.64]|uniref:SGNH hydrolase-type esterase domain-containing protein n=1 Tax=Massarina eburnea CBS 473.64 TaxID=1395130 RepID=A0A6A6RVN1_9PLEO|nr:hypothetical protein P280DRAFT_481838 [Massarina eburnea CBS 473.64]